MKRLGFLIVLMLGIVSLLVAGCGGGGEEATPTPTPEATTTATPVVTPPTTATATPAVTLPSSPTPAVTPPPGELSNILGLTSSIESLKYEMVMTGPGMPEMTVKVWQKTNKMKTETTVQGMTIVTYIDYDAQRLCAYMPDMGMVMASDFSMAQENPLEQPETIVDYHPTIIGSETIDGEDCLVFEWTAEGVTSKWWVSKDDGFPRRTEITTAEGTTTTEYSNVEFVAIPDSEFAFPPACGE